MADSADRILTVAEARAELRLADEAQDDLLERNIRQAIAWVSREISTPLLDESRVCYAVRPAPREPLVIDEVVAFRQVDAIDYWSPDGALREDPDGAVTGWGRVESGRRRVRVWPPADGWPEVLGGSCLRVTVTCGVDFDAQVDDLRAAVVLAVRQLYDGAAEIRPTAAIYALVSPWKRYD